MNSHFVLQNAVFKDNENVFTMLCYYVVILLSVSKFRIEKNI